MIFTKEQDDKLKNLVSQGKYFYREIADIMNLPLKSLYYRSSQLGLKNKAKYKRCGEWNRKHAHLRKDLLTYFLNHSSEETMKKFNLTHSEFKSCMTYAYIDPNLTHLRKDKRNQKTFLLEDWIFMIKRLCLLSRSKISFLSGRSKKENPFSVKERLAKIGASTKMMNGLNISFCKIILPSNVIKDNLIITKAGPSGLNGNFNFKIIPWVVLDNLSDFYIKDDTVKECIKIMAKLQRFIYNKKDDDIVNEMKYIINEV